jgi:methyltransferase (TIGR00027 family)
MRAKPTSVNPPRVYPARVREDSKRSHTAEGAAALRAAGARASDANLRNPDTMAERLIGWQYQLRVRIMPLRALSLRVIDHLMPGLFPFITARTKHLDALLLQEIRAGAEQVVILGAGADSRAHRFADELADVHVYEVDHPATGEWKRRQMIRLFGALPERVSYVPVDFSVQTLDDGLDSAGVDRNLRTVFLWEGVAPYLPPDAVDATLTSITRFAAGSSVVFDYLYEDVIGESSTHADGRKYQTYLAKHGEPLLSGLDPDTLDAHLAKLGLELVDNAGPDELRRRHLAGSTVHITPFSSIAHARVPAQ